MREIADLQGRRLVIASETEIAARLRIQLVKKLTGETTLKTRRMYGEWYEFQRTHTIVLQTNNKPVIREDTEAVWRRILLLPFNTIIPAPERDTRLLEKLKAEAAGDSGLACVGLPCMAKGGLGRADGGTGRNAAFQGGLGSAGGVYRGLLHT